MTDHALSLGDFAGRVQGSPELLRRGMQNPPSANVLFLGHTGVGKTSFAVAMLDAWVRLDPMARRGAMYVEAGDLVRARADHRRGEKSPVIEACVAAPLLLLDDLGNEGRDFDSCLRDVVSRRHNEERPTWITCVLSPETPTLESFAADIARRYDGGFARRIFETGKHVTLGGR